MNPLRDALEEAVAELIRDRENYYGDGFGDDNNPFDYGPPQLERVRNQNKDADKRMKALEEIRARCELAERDALKAEQALQDARNKVRIWQNFRRDAVATAMNWHDNAAGYLFADDDDDMPEFCEQEVVDRESNPPEVEDAGQ